MMSSAADPRWDRLTSPAKAAWHWAWAMVLVRTGAGEPAELPVGAVDLFAGLTLAQPRDNPARQLLTHFQIPLGVLFPDGGPRRYRVEAVLAAAGRVPADVMPPLDESAGQVLAYTFESIPARSDGLVTLSMLFGALLETPNPVSAALRAELADRGVDVEPVMRSCRERRVSYAEYLGDRHPYHPPGVPLAPLVSDEPLARRPPGRPGAEPRDWVDIRAEVNAFAYLIASRTLTPPLAVGLFGDWGSGKSYFLRSVQRRIDELADPKEERTPFYRAIAQVEFNAWQYVEGNLWASLLEHLFRNLRPAGAPDQDDLLQTHQGEYLTQITELTEEHRSVTEELSTLTEKQQWADQAVQDISDQRDKKLDELARARRRSPFRGWTPSRPLSEALDEVRTRTGLPELSTEADELAQTLVNTSETLRRAGPLFGALRIRGWGYAAGLIAVLALVGVSSVVLGLFDVSAVANLIASGSVFLAAVTTYAARGNTILTSALGAISTARGLLNAELDTRREELDKEVHQAEQALERTERELASKVEREQRLTARIGELEAERARITPSSVLTDFVGNRFASDDYRHHLGVPALVRQDLERLSRLIQQHQDTVRDGPAAADEHAIDRVVLYIDDLDRCPTDVVIKVLEAVHLLLAFPLFVVVVAVDTRWLESSLRAHYTQLRRNGAAAPSDYLEKIFQVPFWVRPLGPDTRREMLRGLLTPHLVGTDPAEPAEDGFTGGGPVTDLSAAELPEFAEVVESFGVTDPAQLPWQQAAKLTVTGPELALIEELSPLVGATPRAVKRFINIYLLLTSTGRGRGWTLPDQGQVALLLAISTGLPQLADHLLPALARVADEPRTLRHALPEALDGDDAPARAQLARLHTWLAAHPDRSGAALSGTERWTALILRFRFTRTPDSE